jgi:hypothetical protein
MCWFGRLQVFAADFRSFTDAGSACGLGRCEPYSQSEPDRDHGVISDADCNRHAAHTSRHADRGEHKGAYSHRNEEPDSNIYCYDDTNCHNVALTDAPSHCDGDFAAGQQGLVPD